MEYNNEPFRGGAVEHVDNRFLVACQQLEDEQYTQQTKLASSWQMFKQIVEGLPAYRDLVGMIQADRKSVMALFKRVQQLVADFPDEEGQRHPHDTPIAIYLLAFMTVKPLDIGLHWVVKINEMGQVEE